MTVEQLKAYYRPGAIVYGYGGWARVIKFNCVGNGWQVSVISCDVFGNVVDAAVMRTHCTSPSPRYFLATALRIRSQVCTCGMFGPFGECRQCRKGAGNFDAKLDDVTRVTSPDMSALKDFEGQPLAERMVEAWVHLR